MITDTPGLSEYQGASVADNLDLIRNALLRSSNLKLVFIITFDNGGYIRDLDVAAVSTVLDGVRRTGVEMTNNYGVIVNRVSPRWASAASAFSSSSESGEDENDKLDNQNEDEDGNESENIKRIHRYIKEKLYEKLDRHRQKDTTKERNDNNSNRRGDSNKPDNNQTSPNHSGISSSTPLPKTDKFLFITTEYDAIDKPDAVLQQNGVRDQLRDFVNKWEGIKLWEEKSGGSRITGTAAMVTAAAELRLEKGAHDNEIDRLYGSSADFTKTNSTFSGHGREIEVGEAQQLKRKTSANIPPTKQDKQTVEHQQHHNSHHQKNDNPRTATNTNSTRQPKASNSSYFQQQQRKQQHQQRKGPMFQFARMIRHMKDKGEDTTNQEQGKHRSNFGAQNGQKHQQGILQSKKGTKQTQSGSQQVQSTMARKDCDGPQELSSTTSDNPLLMLSGRPPLDSESANFNSCKSQGQGHPQFQDLPEYITEHIKKELPQHTGNEPNGSITFEYLQKLWDSVENNVETGGEDSNPDSITDSNSGNGSDNTHSNIIKKNERNKNYSTIEPSTLLQSELNELGLVLKTDQSYPSEMSTLSDKAATDILDKSSEPESSNPSSVSLQLCRVIADKQFKEGDKIGFYYGEIHFKSPWPEQDLVVTMGTGQQIEFSQNIDRMGGLRCPHAVKYNSSSVDAWIVPMSFCALRYMRRVHSHGSHRHDEVNVGVKMGIDPKDTKFLSVKELSNHQLIMFFATRDVNVGDELLFWAN